MQQLEKAAWEAGDLTERDLVYWQPGQVIKNRIRIEAGHTVGKTKLAAGLVNHFFDCFPPAIVYTFAPTWEQIHDLLWKEIKADRSGKGLPGRILDLALDNGPAHFAKGRATSNAGGRGTERVQGQHGPYLMFVLDEAEGVAEFVWDAVDSMTSGGISIVLMLANPRTRTSVFHKAAAWPNVANFRISCLWHPNVLAGRELVPGAVRREYVEDMLSKHCEQAEEHDPDLQTFEVPWRPGVIYRPDAEFLFRVLGVAPLNLADNTLIPVGRYEAAINRAPAADDGRSARIGVDVARYGQDLGTIYVRHRGRVWRAAQLAQQDTFEYTQRVKREIEALMAAGARDIHVRVDGTGGFGGGLIDQLKRDLALRRALPGLRVLEVQFGAAPYAEDKYADLVTEMYAEAAEAIQGLSVTDPPAELEQDLCERCYKWMQYRGQAVKKLEQKDDFKKRIGRSPDDGDGFVLAVAPDFIFGAQDVQIATQGHALYGSRQQGSRERRSRGTGRGLYGNRRR